MRKIEQQMVDAVKAKATFSSTNTDVVYIGSDDTSKVYLHNNHIGTYTHNDGIFTVNENTLFCWPTNTTKSRLRALGVNVTTSQGVTYLGGNEV